MGKMPEAVHQKQKRRLRPPDTRKHTVLPVSIRLKSTEKTPACVSMWAFLQPISARIYFGKTASHRKRARFVQSRGASPQAYWMSVKAAQRRGCAKRAFCGVCFLMPGGLKRRALVCSGQSSMRPSVEMVTTCQGMSLPQLCRAVFTACSSPPQQGTSMRTTVRSFMSLLRRMAVSFSA